MALRRTRKIEILPFRGTATTSRALDFRETEGTEISDSLAASFRTQALAVKPSSAIAYDDVGRAARQRLAVGRAACSDQARESRRERQRDLGDARGRTFHIDGYNLLTTIEAALAGGVILSARDGCYRDLAGVHGTFRKVRETAPAIALAGGFLGELRPERCIWYLDSPVSNSGRLKTTLRETAERAGWPWSVELVFNPDRVLAASAEPVVTTDSMILDRCASWLNLAAAVIASRIGRAWVIDLSG